MNFGQFLDTGLGKLYFDGARSFDRKRPRTGQTNTPSPIVREIESELVRCFATEAPATLMVRARASRLKELIGLTDGWVSEFDAIDRSVTGIGIPTPLENGIHLDWSTGWPVVPGAGIKGAVLAWASAPDRTLEELNVACEEDFVDLHIAIFGCGPGEDDDESAVGGIIFHDAWYLPGSTQPIMFDVMTPHYGDYQKGGDPVPPPADWSDPNPIQYLCVPEGVRLQVGIAPRTPIDFELVDIARHWLILALADIGLGAKTASGFGRFLPAPAP